MKDAYLNYKTQIDSLTNAGFEIRWLEPGFQKADLSDSIRKSGSLPYWTLISAFEKSYGWDRPVVFFSSNGLHRFAGKRSSIRNKQFNWHLFPRNDSVNTALKFAYRTKTDSLRLLIAESEPFSARYSETEMPLSGSPDGSIQINIDKGDLFAEEKIGDGKINRIPIDTGISITVFHPEYNDQHQYILAALNAIAEVTGMNTRINPVREIGLIPARQDWVFNLSTLALPDSIQTRYLFQNASGSEKAIRSYLQVRRPGIVLNGIELYKQIEAVDTSGNFSEIIWETGWGDPLLEKKDNRYLFYSRFSPAWSGLVWSERFPELILQLIMEENVRGKMYHEGIIDSLQAKPAQSQSSNFVPTATRDSEPINKLILPILILLFFTERFISYKRNING